MSNAVTAVGATERAFMAQHAEFNCKASISGRLYDVGLYPGAILLGHRNERVFGELWQLSNCRTDLIDILDIYEGCAQCSPKPHNYSRRKVVIRATNGVRRVAWMYVWNGIIDPTARIANGRWEGPGRTLPVAPEVSAYANRLDLVA
jgi:gamma-glutamylcyclotransferase (GGCT)/AIG2-like uncharacterized protein YtfP